ASRTLEQQEAGGLRGVRDRARDEVADAHVHVRRGADAETAGQRRVGLAVAGARPGRVVPVEAAAGRPLGEPEGRAAVRREDGLPAGRRRGAGGSRGRGEETGARLVVDGYLEGVPGEPGRDLLGQLD